MIRRKYCLVIVSLLILYILIYILINSSNHHHSTSHVSSTKRERKSNEIELILDIQDIYRVDISCEFITKHLGSRISEIYKNTKTCSLSSLSSKLNENLKKSIHFVTNDIYRPIYETKEENFNIFKNDPKQYLTNFISIQNGGFYQPKLVEYSACSLDQIDFLAFIVPYYNRIENLNLLILNLHNYLTTNTKYQFSYVIIVAEQSNTIKFNKGQIINTAVKYVNEYYNNVDCIILHDVDLIPIVNDSSIDYRCRQMPVHLTNQVLIMKSNWNRVYNQFLTGGIISLRPNHFISSSIYTLFLLNSYSIFFILNKMASQTILRDGEGKTMIGLYGCLIINYA